jgi:protein-S-isoprenylcysteine O-methyltransferase Ste14
MVRLPPPVWGFIYLVVFGCLSALLPWRTVIDLRSIPIGVVLVIAGLLLMFSALRLFRVEGTELNPTSETNKSLVVRGPYRFTRNPMYLGLVVLTLGIAILVGSLPMFAVPVFLFATSNWVHIPFEEAKMQRQFGQAFDTYTHNVRRWL